MKKSYSLAFWFISIFILVFQTILFIRPTIEDKNNFTISNIGYEVISIFIVVMSAMTITTFTTHKLYSIIGGIIVPTLLLLVPNIIYLFLKNRIAHIQKYSNYENAHFLDPLRNGNELLMVFHLLYILQTIGFLFFIHTMLNIDPSNVFFDAKKTNMYILLCSIFLLVMSNVNSWIIHIYYDNVIEMRTDDKPI